MTSTASLLAALPAIGTVRFTAARKAAIANAVSAGALDREEAKARYALTDSELETWLADLSALGVAGLRATRLQLYRALPA
jgi:hypothetical protein